MSKKDAVVFDLNNTLRKKSGEPRRHILDKAKKDIKKEKVIIISGESSKDQNEARSWLDTHGLKNAELDMRPKGDTESDDNEKAGILGRMVSRQFTVKKAYDDKPKNVKMFKAHGIKAKKV
jgi:FMN phosphatase YigB (HAD superfamily)